MKQICLALVSATLVLSNLFAPAGAASSDAYAPAGVNDWSCQPSAEHPQPVVLLHTDWENTTTSFSYLGPQVVKAGYCVYAVTYGVHPRLAPLAGNPAVPAGLNPMEESAVEVGAFVEKVRAATGAAKVDLVAYSAGALVAQHWLRFLGGQGKVDDFVAIAPAWRGSTLYMAKALADLGYQLGATPTVLAVIGLCCAAWTQQLAGSPFLEKLGDGPVPGAKYTTIMVKNDEVLTPWTTGYMDRAVNNWVLQDVCPNDVVTHMTVTSDPVAEQLALNALSPTTATPVDCSRALVSKALPTEKLLLLDTA